MEPRSKFWGMGCEEYLKIFAAQLTKAQVATIKKLRDEGRIGR